MLLWIKQKCSKRKTENFLDLFDIPLRSYKNEQRKADELQLISTKKQHVIVRWVKQNKIHFIHLVRSERVICEGESRYNMRYNMRCIIRLVLKFEYYQISVMFSIINCSVCIAECVQIRVCVCVCVCVCMVCSRTNICVY